MRRVPSSLIASALAPDPSSAEPLHKQLYERLREHILSRRLAPGLQLPSTRVLASDLVISRTPILHAIEQLKAEGYLEACIGSGTYVARFLPEQRMVATQAVALTGGSQSGGHRQPGFEARRVVPHKIRTIPRAAYRPFQSGFPALDEFPFVTWSKLLQHLQTRANSTLLGYGSPVGYLPLRRAIASYLTIARGMRCDEDQVIVVSGAQQAFGLAVRALAEPGDSVLLEDPGYFGAQTAFDASSVKLLPVPIDQDGLIVPDMHEGARARILYTTPANQFPLGVTMSVARRRQLLNWAHKSGVWILEDDYDGEFRYSGCPLPSLQSLDFTGSVIYVGTFSKVLFPGLRLGYIVVPAHLVEVFVAAKRSFDYHCPMIEQFVTAEFINDGHFARHIRRMRTLYLERLEALLEAARAEMNCEFEIRRPDAGMHVVARLGQGVDDQAVATDAAHLGISTIPLSSCYLGPDRISGLVLGFAGYKPQQIRSAMQKLSTVIAAHSCARRA
jgi:GntR family transcriptional regulator/MocR family aminotransferase